MSHSYKYLIIGGGLAGVSAIEGIRQVDAKGTIGLLGAEDELPYNRPPLSKDLLWGKKTYDEIFIHDLDYFRQQKVDLHLKTEVKRINVQERFVTDTNGHPYGYSRLLIATGGHPRTFPKAGKAVQYFQNTQDYHDLAQAIVREEKFLVIGGGFIGAELSAALTHLGKKVTMLFRGKSILQNIFPADLSDFVTQYYRQQGVTLVADDEPVEFESRGNRVQVATKAGQRLEAGWVIAGIGMEPETALAQSAGLAMDRGVIVSKYLQTSRQEIFAAGDLARFPCEALGESVRLEHWDNASAQGKCAGINMAGDDDPYVYLSYFYSDLFDLGFEAVGKLDSKMKTISAWEEPFRKGIVVYLEDQKVKGVLLWNQGKILDWARKLITEQATPATVDDLKRLLPTPAVV
jgi:NADPH-dependent 2,4-dienoyl-CoA reductase/sulfur reductase-like enzyme